MSEIKRAHTEHPVLDAIAERWSPRAFADQPVSEATLSSLLEAARWAASSYNEQPWSFIVAAKEAATAFSRILECLVEGNRAWARQAPLLMVSVAQTTFSRNGKPNRHAWHDVGQAAANLAVQASALGLQIHQMAGFDAEKATALLHIPAGYEPVACIAVGYPGDVQQLPENLRTAERAERKRKPLSDFVFFGEWGEKSHR